MPNKKSFAEEALSQTTGADLILGRLKQLQTRYPRLIRDIQPGKLFIDVDFFLEDVAIDATHALLDAGVTAVHRMNYPRILSLQLPSLFEQHQEQQAIDQLDHFLGRWTAVPIQIAKRNDE